MRPWARWGTIPGTKEDWPREKAAASSGYDVDRISIPYTRGEGVIDQPEEDYDNLADNYDVWCYVSVRLK